MLAATVLIMAFFFLSLINAITPKIKKQKHKYDARSKPLKSGSSMNSLNKKLVGINSTISVI